MQLFEDIRYAWRQFMKAPGFTRNCDGYVGSRNRGDDGDLYSG